MKNLFALLCVFALATLGNTAHASTKCSLGVKGGANLADVYGVDFDNSMRTGFSGGAFGDLLFTEQFGMRIEGLYTMKGYTVDTPFGELTGKFDYIEFPVMFLAALPAGETVVVDLFAGPTFGFNVKAESEAPDGDTEDISDVTESFEFGAALGAGLELVRSSFSIVFDARVSLGATSVFDVDPDDDVADAKNRGFAFMVGAKFPIGGE
jgi:Outer membrane protein beta-barrel domain